MAVAGRRIAVHIVHLLVVELRSLRFPQPRRIAFPVTHVAALVAVGVNAEGKREVLGLEVVTGGDGAGWLAFVRGLVARGLAGVQLAISDAHPGLRQALAATLPGAT
jgi:transposase-like protein